MKYTREDIEKAINELPSLREGIIKTREKMMKVIQKEKAVYETVEYIERSFSERGKQGTLNKFNKLLAKYPRLTDKTLESIDSVIFNINLLEESLNKDLKLSDTLNRIKDSDFQEILKEDGYLKHMNKLNNLPELFVKRDMRFFEITKGDCDYFEKVENSYDHLYTSLLETFDNGGFGFGWTSDCADTALE